jgi:predicted N-acetyltransferase YhbS
METIIRRASIADKAAIWKFIKVAYGDFSKHMIPKQWTWQYRENPYVKKEKNLLPILLAIKDDQIVGQTCVTPVELKIGDAVYPATWGTDFNVLSDFRGEALGVRLMQVELEHSKLMIGLSMSIVTRKIAEYLGYKKLNPVNINWRPVRLHRSFVYHIFMRKTRYRPLGQLIKKLFRSLFFDWLISTIFNIFCGMKNIIERRSKKKCLCDIQEVDYFDERIDSFWHSTSGQYEIIVKRDKEYLNWRYSRDHQLTYRKFIATKDGQVKGYLVLRKAEPEELNVGKIVDLYARRDDPQTIEDFILHAIQFFGNDVEVLECVTSTSEYQQILSKFGFFKVRTEVPMYRCEDSSLADKIAIHRRNCFFTKGDHDWDQFRPAQEV